jgi:hypothetical protein
MTPSQEIVRGLNKIEEEDTRKMCLNKPTRDECISQSTFQIVSLLALTERPSSISTGAMISRLYPTIVMQHKLPRFRFRRSKTSTGKEFFVCFDVSIPVNFGLTSSFFLF